LQKHLRELIAGAGIITLAVKEVEKLSKRQACFFTSMSDRSLSRCLLKYHHVISSIYKDTTAYIT
jgi:hypothetical protein